MSSVSSNGEKKKKKAKSSSSGNISFCDLDMMMVQGNAGMKASEL